MRPAESFPTWESESEPFSPNSQVLAGAEPAQGQELEGVKPALFLPGFQPLLLGSSPDSVPGNLASTWLSGSNSPIVPLGPQTGRAPPLLGRVRGLNRKSTTESGCSWEARLSPASSPPTWRPCGSLRVERTRRGGPAPQWM